MEQVAAVDSPTEHGSLVVSASSRFASWPTLHRREVVLDAGAAAYLAVFPCYGTTRVCYQRRDMGELSHI